MDKKNQLNELLQEGMAKMRELADTNTIIGQPIQTPDGVTLIPISRVSMGFGGGGGVFGNKKDPAAEGNLGGGVGTGVKIEPVAFLVVKDGTTRVLPVAMAPMNTIDRVVDMVPDAIDRVSAIIDRKKTEKAEKDVIAE